MQKLALIFLAFSLVTSCNYDPGFGDLACDSEGSTDQNGRVCQDGYWVGSEDITPDMDLDQELDVPEPDMPDLPDMPDMECVPETDEEMCTAMQSNCGQINSVDRCGAARVLECGDCVEPETCGAVTPNQCGCVPQSRLQFCLSYSKSCDEFTELDNCGEMRTEDCGTCQAPAVCGGGGTANTCACPDQSDAEFCLENGANCGPVENTDECGQLRLVSCGTCTGTGESCGGGGTANVCGCTPESNEDFCDRVGKNCGSVTENDNCGQPRTVDCGGCTMPESCGAGGQPNVCGCGADSTVCGFVSKNCGTVDSTMLCSNKASVSCGTCNGTGETCGGGSPSVANVCGCAPENNTRFCNRNNKNCGTFSGTDNCGDARNGVNCGTCTGTGETCGGGSPSVANVCGCAPENNTQFCDRNGKDCGTFSGTDNCGDARNNVNCGSCTGTGETCGGGTPAETNVCGCTAESNNAFCLRNSVECGSFSGTDNCGDARSVTCPNTCTSPETCGGATPSVPNTCGCTPQSNTAFCADNGKNCGLFSGTDNCGLARTDIDCGTCGAINETCGGGDPGVANVCGCTPEDNATFCSRNNVECGSFTGTDNCGDPRTNVACADTCTGPETCAGGTPSDPNVCGCTAETDVELCEAATQFCGALNVEDSCGVMRSVTCNRCASPYSCDVNDECSCTCNVGACGNGDVCLVSGTTYGECTGSNCNP